MRTTDARRPASNPLVIPSLAGGLFALVATLTIRVPLHAVLVAALAIGVIVLGHPALARSTGNLSRVK